MTSTDELLDSLCSTAYPYAAMEAAQRHKAAVVEPLLERLHAAADDDIFTGYEHILAVILLTRFRETRAHAPIVSLARRDAASDLLGDFATEFLPAALWHTCGGDDAHIRALLEDDAVDPFSRSSAARALVIGMHFGDLDEADTLRYLVERIDTCEHAELTILLISNVLDLYPTEHLDALRERIIRDDLGAAFFDLEYFDRFVEQGPEPAAERLRESLMRFGDIPLHAIQGWPIWEDPTTVRRTIGGKISLGRRSRKRKKRKR